MSSIFSEYKADIFCCLKPGVSEIHPVYISIYPLQERVPKFDYFLEMCTLLRNLLRLLLHCGRSSFSEREAKTCFKSWRRSSAFVSIVPGSFVQCTCANTFEANLNNIIMLIKNQTCI